MQNEVSQNPSPAPATAQRPALIWIISGWSVFQFLMNCYLFLYVMRGLVREGTISPAEVAYPVSGSAVMLVAGLLLFFRRKAAIYFFGVYFLTGLAKIFFEASARPGYLANAVPGFVALGIVAAITWYCLRLLQKGVLR